MPVEGSGHLPARKQRILFRRGERSPRSGASAGSLSNGGSCRPIIELAATWGEAPIDAALLGSMLRSPPVARPRIGVMYRFLIKIHPRAATSLRLPPLLVSSFLEFLACLSRSALSSKQPGGQVTLTRRWKSLSARSDRETYQRKRERERERERNIIALRNERGNERGRQVQRDTGLRIDPSEILAVVFHRVYPYVRVRNFLKILTFFFLFFGWKKQ